MIHHLQRGYKVVYAAEAVPRFAIGRLSGMNREIRQHVKNKTLMVVDPELLYSGHLATGHVTSETIADKWLSFIDAAADRSRSPILVVSTPELLTKDGELETLQAVSEALDKKSTSGVEVICCYSLDWFFGLDLGRAISLMLMNEQNLSRHGLFGDAAAKSKILDAISRGLDNSLGNGSGRLILTTLSFLHNMGQDGLLSDPHSFEVKLRKLVGNAADHAIPELLNAFKDELISSQHLMRGPYLPAR
jgi:hypothetical protein